MCPWKGFEDTGEGEAWSIYQILAHPLTRDFPMAREIAWKALNLRMTRREVQMLFQRLLIFDEALRQGSDLDRKAESEDD